MSGIEIHYCPWCGQKLPFAKRDLWFSVLAHLGFEDPLEDDIPQEFHDNSWYVSDVYSAVINLLRQSDDDKTIT